VTAGFVRCDRAGASHQRCLSSKVPAGCRRSTRDAACVRCTRAAAGGTLGRTRGLVSQLAGQAGADSCRGDGSRWPRAVSVQHRLHADAVAPTGGARGGACVELTVDRREFDPRCGRLAGARDLRPDVPARRELVLDRVAPVRSRRRCSGRHTGRRWRGRPCRAFKGELLAPGGSLRRGRFGGAGSGSPAHWLGPCPGCAWRRGAQPHAAGRVVFGQDSVVAAAGYQGPAFGCAASAWMGLELLHSAKVALAAAGWWARRGHPPSTMVRRSASGRARPG